MTLRAFTCFLAIGAFCGIQAQTPDLSGIWKAQPEASRGLPPGDYLVLIETKGGMLTETTGTYGPRGEMRSVVSYDLSGKESLGTNRGLPMKSTATWDGNSLSVASKVAGPQGISIRRKYTLSPDGKTLTVENTSTMNGRDMQQTIVLAKQPDSVAEPLRKPEQTAGTRYQNVQLLKDLPASRFMDVMNVFAVSLGTNCQGCHIQGNFASDDKKEKGTARQMLKMTQNINEQTFGGKMEVRCWSCHRGQKHPDSQPGF